MSGSRELHVPPDATPDEAAAITAAVERWLAAETRAREDEAVTSDWDDRRFAFAGRVAKLTGTAVEVPNGAPADPWTAMGRIRRR
jgi:hypothetical protein